MTARSLCQLCVAIGAVTVATNPVRSQSPTTTPIATTQVSLSELLSELSDPDPQTRDNAKQQLMGLHLSDLPALRELVSCRLPLQPGVVQSLQQIVTQVYLSDSPANADVADRELRPGFMGVMMAPSSEGIVSDSNLEDDEPCGALIENRTPGFAAYQMLRDGDLIVAVATQIEANGAQPVRVIKQPVLLPKNMIDIVGALPAGRKIIVTVLRAGRKLDVELSLGARPRSLPMQAMQGEYEQFIEVQTARASDFWNAHFAALVDQFIL